MELDRQACYRALESRDRRFDGRFFTAVRTTGIYCRPICPAPTPRLKNVVFYRSAAAAAESGFRPCFRCHPESAPGTTAWAGAVPVVNRALRLISEGALDRGGVEQLCGRLGLGSRQLSRLFREHLGTSPVAVAQTRRVNFASKLLHETRLPMADVAFNSGFSSVRRFNDAMRRTFGEPPREIRRHATTRRAENGSPSLVLRLAYRPPFAWDAACAFLGARAMPGVESVSDGVYSRTVVAGEVTGVAHVDHDPNTCAVHARLSLSEAGGLMGITERLRRLFDLSAAPDEIGRVLRRDRRLAEAVRAKPGLRVPGAFDGFEIAVRAILGQQVSVKAARTLAGRLVAEYGKTIDGTSLEGLFPTAEWLADADLPHIGLPASRARTVQLLARAVADGDVALGPGADDVTARRALGEIPGIGPWTVEYIAMRVLADPDAFPAGDLILRRVASDSSTPLTEKELLRRSEIWRPWRAYAVMYLWRLASEETK